MLKKLLSLMILTSIPLLATPESASDVNQLATRSRHSHKPKKHKKHSHSSHKHSHKPNCCQQTPAQWGYFFINDPDNEQILDPGDAVNWNVTNATSSSGIFISPSDNTQITITYPGVYEVIYTTEPVYPREPDAFNASYTLESNLAAPFGDVQFALYLNSGSSPIPGSTYAIGDVGFGNGVECTGQVIFTVFSGPANLSLNNQCETSILLTAETGTGDLATYGPNVAASLAIQRIDTIH